MAFNSQLFLYYFKVLSSFEVNRMETPAKELKKQINLLERKYQCFYIAAWVVTWENCKVNQNKIFL